MYATIQKWGNSSAVRLPKSILETLRLKENDRVEILTKDSQIIIKPSKYKYSSLDELFEGYTGNYICTEADTGVMEREVL